MLVVEPAEPCIYNVRLHQAYRTTVTLRNDTRNALELTVRAGSPERWAVAPSTVFLEAGRTMRVDLRLKLARELRPKKTAGAAVVAGDDEHGKGVRQRDVFHVKGEFFEQKFHASFVMATPEEVAAAERREQDSRSRSTDHPGVGERGRAPVASTSSRDTHRARSHSPASSAKSDEEIDEAFERARLRYGGGSKVWAEVNANRSTSAPAGRGRGTRGTHETEAPRPALGRKGPHSAQTGRRSHVHWEDETAKKIDGYRRKVDELEKLRHQSAQATGDKDELIRALYARLELAKTHEEDLGGPTGADDPFERAQTLHASRVEQAELHGANAALRGRVQELDSECQASRDEIAGLKRRVRLLEQDIAPDLPDLVHAALEQERAAFETQSLKALRVLEAKDAVLLARERETAEARAESGALSTTLHATRRELDACEARVVAILEEREGFRAAHDEQRLQWAQTEKSLRAEVEKLGETLRIADDRLDRTKAELKDAIEAEEDAAFSRAEAAASTAALHAANEEASELRAALRAAAEARISERERLAAHVASARSDLEALKRRAPEEDADAAALARDLDAAHESLAAALKDSAADRILSSASDIPESPRMDHHTGSIEAPSPLSAKTPAPKPTRISASRGRGQVEGSGPGAEVAKLRGERDEALERLAQLTGKETSVAALARGHATEVAGLQLRVKELESGLRVKDGEHRREKSSLQAEHAAESESLRTELAALRDRLRFVDGERANGGDLTDEARRAVEHADEKARAAEAETFLAREKLAEMEAAAASERESGRRSKKGQGTTIEQKLSARVSELVRELRDSNDKVAELEDLLAREVGEQGVQFEDSSAASAMRQRVGSAEDAQRDAEDRLNAAELRWGNERARLESKIRAAKEDGGVRIQSLEATVASLRARSGLHSEVARLGEEASRIRRSEAALKNDLTYAEERLGHALLEIQRLGGEASTGNTPADARRAGALALRSGNLPAKSYSHTTPPHALDKVVSLEKENNRLVAENEQLRNDVEAHALERGRDAAARADASRELASALDRVAERDRALHDARESAALGKERAAAQRAQELTAATRRSAAAEARASESESRASLAREEANEARADCARKLAAADGARHAAEREAAAARESAANEVSNAEASAREAQRLSQLLDERATQLQILTETVEALQAAAGSGDREQRVVTLAAQAATARASESALERRCAELSQTAQRETARCARIESQLASANRDIQSATQRAREAEARETLAREETGAARLEAAHRTEEIAALARRCDAAAEAKVAAESREASARDALSKQHARHLAQLTAEREGAADRLKTAELNAARAVQVAAGGADERSGAVGARVHVRASEDIASIVSMQPEDAVAAVLEATRVRERIEHALEEVVKSAESHRALPGVDENDPIAAAVVGTRRELEAERRWSGAVIQRMRQLVLEAEREVGRAFARARSAQAGEQAAEARAHAVEAALDARTAAWEEATSACVAAEERLARRSTVDVSCADQRFQLAQQRIGQIAEQLAAAQRRCVAAESASMAAKEIAKTETDRADAESRRARVAEADAAAARQAAAAAAEELEGSPAATDAVRDLKSYLEKEVVRALVGDGKAKDKDEAGAKLAGVTRELCASKLTERSLLASLAANRRRADAAAGHAAELQQALKMAETRIQALVSGDRAESSGTTSPEDSAEALSTQLAHKAHEAYQAREEVLRLRARVSELELEVADLAGAREAAAAAASSAREGAKIEIAASAARAADDFAAKSASLRRELDTERSVLQAAVREAQATANKARLDAAAEIAEERRRLEESASAPVTIQTGSFADAEEEIRALRLDRARQEDRARRATAEAADLRDEVQSKDSALQQLKRAFASADNGGLGLGVKTPSSGTTPGGTSAAKKGGKRNPKTPSSEPASSSGALGRRLVEAKLAEADAQRRLKIASRAETELRDIVNKRDARIAELRKKLAAKPGSDPAPSSAPSTPQGDDESRAALEAECAKLRAEKSRADAESERLRATLEAQGAHAPSPEEMDALQAEVTELRRAVAESSAQTQTRARAEKKSEKEAAERRDLQKDVNTAVSSAAAALTGSPLPHAARNPASGTATAAVAQLANALKESNNATTKARAESAEAKRVLRERGKERETKELTDASQRSVIRELTQRAASLGRDKAELMEERDSFKERLRGLRGVEDWNNTRPEEPKPSIAEAATQSGSLGGRSVLVDAAALVNLVGAHVDALGGSVSVIAERAAVLGDEKVARVANTLSVETAAMRAALDALADPECEGLTPTELVTKAATAAMRAMPAAPLVHHIVPSVVAPVMRVAPLLADPNVTDAPVARLAITRTDVGTDVNGLATVRDHGINTAPVTTTTRCGPDLSKEDPHLFGIPRDTATSPGVGPRIAMVPMDAPQMIEAGTYSGPVSHDAGVGTEVTGASDEEMMKVTQLWEAALEGEQTKAAALEDKVGKWKERCESLRAELAAVMEKTASTERSLRERLAKEEKIEGAPKERVEELEGLLHGVGAAGNLALEASRKESAEFRLQLERAQRQLVAATKETERLRHELRGRDAEHANMVSSLRTTIRGLSSSPADRAAYLEALKIHSENVDLGRRERDVAAEALVAISAPEPIVDLEPKEEGARVNVSVPAPVEEILAGADDRAKIRDAMRAEEDAERDAIRARAVADAAEAATKLWERGGEIAEQIATAERRLERAVATTASALQAADRGAANAGDRAAKQSRVLAKRLEEVDGAAVSLCAQLTDALARAVEKGEATTAAATRHKETAARLQKEHEADVKRAKEALKKSKQKEEAAEAKARKEETRAKKAEADAARKKTALEVEVNRLKATIEELALRASSSASDSESPPKPQVQSRPTPTTVQPGQLPPTPAMTLMPPLLHASSRPPWSAPGDSPVTHQLTQELVEDAIPAPAHRVETSLSTIVAGPTAAQTAAAELAKRLSDEKISQLQKRLDQYERDLEKARAKANAEKDARAHAEIRAKNATDHLKKFKASSAADHGAMKGKVTDLTAQLAERGPDKWRAMEASLADTTDRLKRARAEIKRLQAVTADTKGSNEALRQTKEKVAQLEEQLKEEAKKIKEARATAKRKDTFAADLKKRLDAVTAEFDALKQVAANDESEDKLREMREEVDRKQALVVQLKSKAEEEAKKAAALAAMSEQERNSESTQRLRREVDRKTEIIKTHDKKIDAMRAEVDAAREAAALAEAAAAKVSAEFGGKSQHLRVRSVTMLTGVRKLAARLLRLSAAVGHTVGAAARADAPTPGPVETGIAELVDMSPDEVADLLGADSDDADDFSRPARVRGGRASNPSTFAALISAMDIKADELAVSLSGSRDASDHGHHDAPAWREDALLWIVQAAEAEAEHAEAALKSAVPAMQEWWIQVLSRGRFPDVRGVTTGFEPVSPGKSPTLRGSRGGEHGGGRVDPTHKGKKQASVGAVTGTRARLAGAAALLASPERDD